MATKKAASAKPAKKAASAKPAKKAASARPAKREPTPAAMLKKVASISDTAKQLSKEIKVVGKIFADNQKVLISMKTMMDAIAVSLEQIQKQSKQISILEDDSGKLFAGLNQVRGQADIIAKINSQTARLEDEVSKIQKSAPKTAELAQQVGDSMDSIRNNSQMIMKIAQRIDGVRDQLREVSTKTESLAGIGDEIESLKKSIESGIDASELRAELEKISQKADATEFLKGELVEINKTIRGISERAEGIDGIEDVIGGLRREFSAIAEKAAPIPSISAELDAIKDKIEKVSQNAGKIDAVEGQVESLARRADAAALVGEGVKSVQEGMGELRQSLADKTNTIEQKISALAGAVRRTDESSSRDVVVLLRLSEFQSKIRMNAESKYGELRDIEGMAEQTRDITRLFGETYRDTEGGVEMPSDVQQWAISKIFDCADRWEIRFSDVFNILYDRIGRENLKEMIRIRQIRDIYGIRAVDEIRGELGIP